MIDYTLKRSKRRTLSIEVTSRAEIIVKAPNRYPREVIDDFVESKKNWIENQIYDARRTAYALFKSGISLAPLEEEELKKLTKEAETEFKFLVDKWYPKVFPEESQGTQLSMFDYEEGSLTELNPKEEKKRPRINRISIRHPKGRWGSCNIKGNLSFNCLLMLAPPEVRDYVVVHELCHFLQMNHSPAFWAEVRRAFPGYEAPYNWLSENGRFLLERIK